MATVLTATEAADVQRVLSTDAVMLALLPQVDAYLRNATGRDWTPDSPIRPEAKAAARLLLVQWYENPGGLGQDNQVLSGGLRAALTQLEAIALSYRQFAGRNGAGAVSLSGVRVGDTVRTLTGLIGVTGDQSTKFESVISVDDQIQQLSADDLSARWYTAYILKPSEL